MGALEAPLSSESRFGDWLTSDLLLHLPPLLAGQQEVHMLGGDVFTEGVLVDTEIHRNLEGGGDGLQDYGEGDGQYL